MSQIHDRSLPIQLFKKPDAEYTLELVYVSFVNFCELLLHAIVKKLKQVNLQ